VFNRRGLRCIIHTRWRVPKKKIIEIESIKSNQIKPSGSFPVAPAADFGFGSRSGAIMDRFYRQRKAKASTPSVKVTLKAGNERNEPGVKITFSAGG